MNEGVDILGFFWSLVSPLLEPIVQFLLSFLPNGDPEIYAIIDSIGNVGGSSTFNIYYFCNWSAVLLCLGVLITVVLIVQVLKLINRSIDLASGAIEKIPMIE